METAETMNVSPTLANKYEEEAHASRVVGWMVSEKLDGVRAVWRKGALWTRGGNRIQAPKHVLRDFPDDIELDGELWMGRGEFNRTSGVCRRHEPHSSLGHKAYTEWLNLWLPITFKVFDEYGGEGDWIERTNRVSRAIAECTFAQMHQHHSIIDSTDIDRRMTSVLERGGEGLMLRNPMAPYQHFRTDDLLKLKPERTMIARVVGHTDGYGRNEGRLGAYECEEEGRDDVRFCVGTGLTDAHRDKPEPVGTLIEVKYQERQPGGAPRFPVFAGRFAKTQEVQE